MKRVRKRSTWHEFYFARHHRGKYQQTIQQVYPMSYPHLMMTYNNIDNSILNMAWKALSLYDETP